LGYNPLNMLLELKRFQLDGLDEKEALYFVLQLTELFQVLKYGRFKYSFDFSTFRGVNKRILYETVNSSPELGDSNRSKKKIFFF
jgi:hypothetical protein